MEQFDLEKFLKKAGRTTHRKLVFGRRIKVLSDHLVSLFPEEKHLKGLDVGCGTGALAELIRKKRGNITIEGVDISPREEESPIKISLFDGKKLPFPDDSFNFCMIVDVCHHTMEPELIFRECLRVSREFVLIKDVYSQNRWDRALLSFMDWVGNRAHDVNLPYNFLSQAQWQKLYETTGVKRLSSLRKLGLYPQPFSLIFDGNLHFIDKLEKQKKRAGMEMSREWPETSGERFILNE